MSGLHIAILTIAGTGHVNPTIDLVAAAIARGHRVSFCAPDGFGAAAWDAGAQVYTYESLLTARPSSPMTPEQFAEYLPFILLAESGHILPQITQLFVDDRPDILLYDRTAYVAGRVLGEIWGCRAIELFPSFAYNDEFSLAVATNQRSVLDPDNESYRALDAQLAEYSKAAGTTRLSVRDLALGLADEAIVFVPRAFQPAGPSFREGYAFVGPCLRARLAEAADSSEPAQSSSPAQIYASLGTAFTDRPDTYQAVLAALALTRRPSILSLGGRPAGSLTSPADSVQIRSSVDQLAVLRDAEVFVTHAGMGGVLEALSFGVPLVCLPGTTEQQAVAARVAELGLGIDLGPGTPSVSDVRAAIDRVRGNRGMRGRLERMRAEIVAAGGAAEALDLVEARVAIPTLLGPYVEGDDRPWGRETTTKMKEAKR